MSAAPPVEQTAPEVSIEKQLLDVKLEQNTPSEPEPPVARKTPIVHPVESAIPPITTPELTTDQQSKYDSLLETVKSWTEVPSTKGLEGPLTEDEIFWLTRECLLRYLRATKWNKAEAAKRLLGTLTWRREYGVGELTGEYISPENETGKQMILGFDIAGRPCQYLNPGRQNTEVSPRQVQHLVFMVERVVDMMPPGQETLALLINFKASKTRTNTAPGIGQGRECLNILQTHYPERLGRALVINMPWVVKGFFQLITPFIDPMTKQKLKFNEDMRQHVPPEQLWTEFAGDLDFEYDHEIYWPALLKACEERRLQQKERWVKGGKIYGESEAYLRGGNAPSLGASPKQEDAAPASVNEPKAGEDNKEPVPEEKDSAKSDEVVDTPIEKS